MKSVGFSMSDDGIMSLPSWERGLKYKHDWETDKCFCVAPLVGAWIEILLSVELKACGNRRSPRGSVD